MAMRSRVFLWIMLGLTILTIAIVLLILPDMFPVTKPGARTPDSLQLTLAGLTQTRHALDRTATHYGSFPRPDPSVTYYLCGQGNSYACTAEALRAFDQQATQLGYEATYAAQTATALSRMSPPTTTPR
jgi:hypothetical protein